MFTSSTYTAIKNAKRDYIAARRTLEAAEVEYRIARNTGRHPLHTNSIWAKVNKATYRLIDLTEKLHAACLNDQELIAIVAAEIDEECAA